MADVTLALGATQCTANAMVVEALERLQQKPAYVVRCEGMHVVE